jgi:hypothetical protein
MATFPTLDFMQIRARYPNAVEKIKEWVFNQEELKAVTADFVSPLDPEGSKEQFVGLLIQMDPRKLYDIFDSLMITVAIHYEPQQSQQWLHWAIPHKGTQDGIFGMTDSRRKAEVSAFNDAFELLENQLSNGDKRDKGLFGDPQS